MFTPMLLNGSAGYSLDCLEALPGRKLTSDVSLGSFLVLGALCCHSEINELDGSLQGRSVPPLMLPDCLKWVSDDAINLFRARGGMEIAIDRCTSGEKNSAVR